MLGVATWQASSDDRGHVVLSDCGNLCRSNGEGVEVMQVGSLTGGAPLASDDWLVGGGEMASVIKAMDWSRSPLGPIASWPQSLRTIVSLTQASNSPMSVIWGPGHVQIYNDGYWPIC